jgi:type IV pilus assembly protein PilA
VTTRAHLARAVGRPHRPAGAPRTTGFTLIELMVVVAVLAILAMIALPNLQDKLVRDQIVEAAKLADLAKAPVSSAWLARRALPADNAAAGLPPADKIVSSFVSAVAIESGAVHITFGNQANGLIRGKVLTLRPAVVDDAPVVPVSWVCGRAAVPGNMSAKGVDRTDVPAKVLPLNCR